MNRLLLFLVLLITGGAYVSHHPKGPTDRGDGSPGVARAIGFVATMLPTKSAGGAGPEPALIQGPVIAARRNMQQLQTDAVASPVSNAAKPR